MLINDLWNSEQATINAILATNYYYRMNVIHKKGSMPTSKIRAIFSAELCLWKFPLHELYKRYALRKNQLGDRNADNLNFWKVSPREIQSFTRWLKRIGSFGNAGEAFKLWSFGEDPDGKPWLLSLIHI